MAPRSPATLYDLDEILARGAKQFERYFSQECGVDPDLLLTTEGPCPKCGGNTRFRVIDSAKGALFCSHCFNRGNGDVFAATQWLLNCSFSDAVKRVASHFGVEPSKHASASGKRNKNLDPAKDLIFQPWREETTELYAYRFIDAKPPVTMAAIKFLGGRFAQYKKRYNVIAFPVWGENAVKNADNQAKPVGWILYNANGGTLPKWNSQEKKNEEVKVKLTNGSQPGIVGNLEAIRAAGEVWKLEGSTDLLAFHSLADLPPGVAALTNANGCGENPQRPDKAFMLEPFRGKVARVCHDCDQPGQRGAIGYHNDKTNRFHDGWAQAIATVATECRNVVLPFEIGENHGKDFRDWAKEGGVWQGLVGLVEKAVKVGAGSGVGAADEETAVLKADDDPHRLARINIEKYEKNNNAVIKFWRNEWYTWKLSRGCYKKIDKEELTAKVIRSIEEEFNRLNLVALGAFKRGQEAGLIDAEETPPQALKITKTLVNNVLLAMTDLCLIPFSVEPMTWISDRGAKQESRNIVAMKNGLIDIEKLIADAPENEVIRQHTPDWFSTICLSYDFNPDAECPVWERFLEKNLEMDPERIKLVQEWAGYLLLPDTGYQKFLAIEGEGRNGKSVFCACLRAMLGEENCSAVSLEEFQERFSRTTMVGKLLNIDPDVGELDKVAESFVKKITSGDKIYFDRKGIGGIECTSTARLILSWNNRPRFRDRSNGIWRRMLLIPWNVTISDDEVVENMDKEWWWKASGELPGIFIWALNGLIRLRSQRRFTSTEIGKAAIEDYRTEANPARSFLLEFCEKSETSGVNCNKLYELYSKWCDDSGYQRLGERVFGKEIRRVFPFVERKRSRDGSVLYWYYSGIAFNTSEINGRRVDEVLF